MWRFAYLTCGDWRRAEDVVQTAFVKLYVAWPRAVKTDDVDAYTRRIVFNRGGPSSASFGCEASNELVLSSKPSPS
ncbi:MAG: sigma factor [Stackebrandtia sp.]